MKSMIFKIHIMVVVFVLMNFSITGAQENEGTPLTLKQALVKVLAQNLDLKEYTNQVRTSNINYRQSKEDLLPDLNASLSASWRYNREYDQETDRTTGQEKRGISAGLQSSLNLFNGFSDIASIRQARSKMKSDKYTLQRQKENILYQTMILFMQAVQDLELIKIEKENLAAQKNQLDLILEFHKAGNRSIADVLQQRADISQAELQLLDACHSYEISRLNLLEILGEEPEMDYQLVVPSEDFFNQEYADPDSILFYSLEKRADWQAMNQNLSVARENVNITRAGYFPSIGLSLSAGSSYSDERQGLSFNDQFTDVNPFVSAGLSLSLPIFDRFRIKNNMQLSRIQVENIELQQEKLKLLIGLDTRQARLEYEKAIKQKEVAGAKLDYARQALEVTEARYNVGSATYVELSQVRANRLGAANEYLQDVYQVMLKMIAWQHQRGRLEEMLVNLNLLEGGQ
jgi:outer membrane protein